MEQQVICIDFDGTICEEDYPGIGEAFPIAIDTIKQLHQQGHRLILNTCREDMLLFEAKMFLEDNDIVQCFEAFNTNLPDRVEKYHNDSRKIGCDLFIDDKSIIGAAWGTVRVVFDIEGFDYDV